jgi:hypothetical protein
MSVAVAAPAWANDMGATEFPPPAVVRTGPLWSGHFSGGYNRIAYVNQRALVWADETQAFSSQSQCRQWLRAMRRTYPTYEGYTSCTRIR